MADTIDPKLVDKRIVERLVHSGQLDEKAYERYVKSLPDLAEKATAVETVMGSEVLDDDEPEADDVDAALATASPEGAPQA